MSQTKPMRIDILRQPEILRALFARRDAFAALGRERLRGDRLHLFGCGDGWFAARAVAAIAEPVFRVAAVAATSLEMLARPLRPRDRAVAISMSGSVDRTNDAAAAILAAGGGCIALSNTDGGALGGIVDAVASLQVPDVARFLTGTTRYSATVLALMMMLEGAGATTRLQGPELDRLLDTDLARILEQADRECDAIGAILAGQKIGGVRVLGAGADWASADYGAAKLVKLLDRPVWGGEIEEFAHSQFWSARGDELVVLLAGTRPAARLAENSAQALRAAGMRTLAIETAGEPVPSASWRLSLPACAPWLAPLAMPAPLQLLAYHLSVATGRDPDVSQDSDDPARFLAAQLLSRRCELSA